MTDFKLVPVEATEEMASIAAMVIEAERYNQEPDDLARLVWSAMCEAAPSPWRPIEEAPKDGILVLVFPGRFIAQYVVGQNLVKDGWNSFPLMHPIQPTHFIPLSALGTPGEADPLDRTEQSEAQQHTGET